jgi:RNA polymerase sigma-70 factor (ECF subfamily)
MKLTKKTYKELALEFKRTRSERTYTELYNKIRPGLFKYINNIVKDIDVANDITSMTLTTVYNKIDQYDESYQITTWAYRIAYNDCVGWLRYKNRKISINAFSDNGIDVDSSSGKLSFQDSISNDPDYLTVEERHITEENLLHTQFEMAKAAINALPPMYKPYMEELLINDRTYDEILNIMKPIEKNINLQTVKNRIFRGRKIVKKQLEGMKLFAPSAI